MGVIQMNAEKQWNEFFEWLMDREGRVVTNDPNDPGGQTCWGISRRYNPAWEGWLLVDRGAKSVEIAPHVKSFYENLLGKYWNSMGDKIREAFCDAYVNMGGGRKGDKNEDAVELLQRSVNYLNAKTVLEVDGVFGNNTARAVMDEDPIALAYTFCALRMCEYRKRKSKFYETGWLNRVQLLIEYISK